jgi:hypothetical protein
VDDYQPVTLLTINGGVAAELFQRSMEKVLENIADPATSPTAVREITLRVRIKPNASRQGAEVRVRALENLPGVQENQSYMLISLADDGVRASVTNPTQLSLADQLKTNQEGA